MTLNSRYSERDKRGQAPADLSSLTAQRHLQHFLHFNTPINHHHEPHTTLCTLFNFPLPYTNTPANIHQTSRVSFILIHLSLSKAALPHRQFLPVLLAQSIAPRYCQFAARTPQTLLTFTTIFLKRLHISKPPPPKQCLLGIQKPPRRPLEDLDVLLESQPTLHHLTFPLLKTIPIYQ